MARVRVFSAQDIPGVAALFERVYPEHRWHSRAACEAYFRETLLENPWRDLDLPSRVAEHAGRIVGFQAIVPRPMRFHGRALRVAVSTQFMVAPEMRHSFTALQLLQHCMAGPQDLTLADGSNDDARQLCARIGIVAPLAYSMHWTRPLRPARYALSRLAERGSVPAPFGAAARPLAAATDLLAARLRPNRFLHDPDDLIEAPLDPGMMLAHLPEMMRGAALRPEYDARTLAWLLDQAARKTRHGVLRTRSVSDSEHRVLGWFLYYLQPGGVSEVLQIVAVEGAFDQVLQRMLADAWRHGSMAVRGRVEPRYAAELSQRHCWFRREGTWTLAHSRHPELIAAIQAGDAFLSRLEGEWWMRYLGEEQSPRAKVPPPSPRTGRFGLETDLRRFHSDRPPVVLLGGLDLLRPLGYAGIPAIVATPDAQEPSLVSRYCSGSCLLPALENRDAAARALIDAGAQLSAALGRRIPLLYGNDDYLELILAYREELDRYFLLLLNAPDIAAALLDKDRFEALALSRGLTVPRRLAWGDTGPDSLGLAQGPVLVKPRVKVGWDASAIHLRLFGGEGKARIFDSGRAVLAHPLAAQLREQLTFQEYIAGDDRHLWSFHGFADENGTLLAWFIGRKLRTFPAFTGMSSYLELAHDDALAALGHQIVARLPLRGIFKIDFKQDARSGRFYLLEINARYNLWHHVAARNGLNLPQVAYDYLVHGLRPAHTRYRATFRWLCLRLDWWAYRELAARGRLTLGAWIASLLRARMIHNLFSWTDPLPFLQAGHDRVRSRLRREREQFMVRLQQWLSTAS
jgi:predicted ATP-grasp superfamily ATP-dependent carboligase